MSCIFQPTLPARGATRLTRKAAWNRQFQPTLPARGATETPRVLNGGYPISTHAPRTGSDGRKPKTHYTGMQFQPTLPARGATSLAVKRSPLSTFQPTLPARGATRSAARNLRASPGHFNPRSPHGERPNQPGHDARLAGHFNPRSPHGERHTFRCWLLRLGIFQPTLPARGATGTTLGFRPTFRRFQPTLPARGATGFRRKALY